MTRFREEKGEQPGIAFEMLRFLTAKKTSDFFIKSAA
jgi:hypothetical protein